MAKHAPTPTVVLVGRRLEDNDNLGLSYLQAAMDGASLPCVRHTVNGLGDVDAVAGRIVERRPLLVGLSLSDGGSAPLLLSLGELLRARGYAGHITCGGPFATLARDWLLTRYGWIDSVVRHAGEAVLPELTKAVMRGESLASIAGVTTRAGDGPCAPVLDRAQIDLTPRRDELCSIAGHRAAHILATRGCEGRCAYCGPASLQLLERKEALRAGFTKSQLDDAGIGGVRRRPVEDVCDEMAELWHRRDVRYFYFVDEHLVPYDEQGAVDYLRRLKQGLDARRVGSLGIGTMLRADRITPAIVEAFVRAGLVRVFLGIEFGTESEARRFGRKTSPDKALTLFEGLDCAGVAVVTNLMLVHPESTPSSIRASLDLLSRVPSGVFETTRMMVYHGTRLWQRMHDEGRLRGNPLRYGYSFDDPTVERFSHIFTRLRAEAFWDHSVAYRTHDAFLALALARKLAPDGVDDEVVQELEAVRRAVNALYVEVYDTALSAACHGGDVFSVGPLVQQAKERSSGLVRRLERCTDRLSVRLGSSRRVFSPMRAASLGAISFVMLAASPSCGGKAVGSESSLGLDAGTGGASATGGSAGSGGASGSGGTVTCSAEVVEQQKEAVVEAVLDNDPCFAGQLRFDSPPADVRFQLDYSGPNIAACQSSDNDILVSSAEASAFAAIQAVDVSCLWSSEDSYATTVEVDGGAQTDADAMAARLHDACPEELWYYPGVAVLIDPSGQVAGVTTAHSSEPLDPEIESCVLNALAGLTFPCLAGYTVCPEYVIAE